MKRLAILGSTGSIGQSALAVAAAHPDRLQVVALVAGENASLLADQASQFRPTVIGMASDAALADLTSRIGITSGTMLLPSGPDGLVAAATHPDVDVVLCATSGSAGLEAALAAIDAGKTLALANKEVMVMAGELVVERARRRGVSILPVDSEHNAIHQCLHGRDRSEVRRMILTASGGPFRRLDRAALKRVTPEDALRHPTWRMGRKISVDSATLANKALEVIEAHFLFGLSYDQIEVVVHPQSIVHSFVEFVDGSVLAQMGTPSMELPVLYALTHPQRVPDAAMPAFDPVAWAPLTFERVRADDFPALALGLAAGRRGGVAPAVFNAANEQAVSLFLENRIRFMDVARAIESALAKCADGPGDSRDAVLGADMAARRHVLEMFAC